MNSLAHDHKKSRGITLSAMPGPAVQHEEDGIGATLASDRDPLLDAAGADEERFVDAYSGINGGGV